VRPLVVEFLGLPGVGKSHATRLVAARVEALGTPAQSTGLRINHEVGAWRRRLTKSGICAEEAIGRPRSSLRVVRSLRRSGQRAPLDVIRLSYNWLFVSRLLRRARTRPAIELLDEGIFQLLWSIGFAGAEGSIRECSDTLLRGPTSVVALPRVVVLVDAPPELVQARLAARGSRAGRVDRMESNQHPAALQRGLDLLAELLSDRVGLIRPPSGTLLWRLRNGALGELEADIDALAAELVSLAAR
jgi:hypothetical protein